LEVVMEWDGSPPHRAPSTDWTPLEMGLYHYREELSKKQKMLPGEEPCDCSKVRYNDTGSLEEVSAIKKVHSRRAPLKLMCVFFSYSE
jgi:hypothetical protein